jgi:hypothetical protein
MKQIPFLFIALFAISILHASGADSPTVIDRPAANAGPTQVAVGIWIVDVTSVDSAHQNFTVEMAVALRWKDPRLAHTESGVTHYMLTQIWHPRVSVVNETNTVSHKLPESVEVDPDGTVLYRQHYAGPFTQPLRLQSFPFDRQTFRVQLVAVQYRPDEVKFVPNQSWIDAGLRQAGGISRSITLPDWTIETWNIKSQDYMMSPGFEFPSYVFEFSASRNAQHYIWNIILPLVLIVAMSWSVFWIPPTEIGPELGVATTSMLTLIAYRFAIDSQLPPLPYTTSLDTFILMSTLLVFFSFIEVLTTTLLESRHQTKQAMRIDRYCRVAFPGFFLLASIFIFLPSRG